jgi:outer membrane protein assembly factor BamB
MPSSRRAVLASALAAGVAGCTDLWSDSDAEPTPTDSTPADAPEYAVWSRDTRADRLGLVSLGGGPETPAVFAASAESGGEPSDEHTLQALGLQDGDERWRLGVADPVQTPPEHLEVDDRSLFVVATGRESRHGEAFVVHAVDPVSGEEAWRFDTDDRRFLFPIAVDDGVVFVGRRDDQYAEDGEYVYALDGADGEQLWRTETGDVGPTGHAARRGVLFADAARGLRALDIEDGEVLWSAEAESQAYDNRAERVFVQQAGVVRGLAHADGAELWRREFEFTVSRITSPRAAMDETVFVGDSGGRLLAVSPLEGDNSWTLPVDRDQGFRPSVARTGERLYVAGAGVHAVDPVSGERAWAFEPDVEGYVHVEAGAPSTVFAHADRHVWALDPESGDPRWTFEPESELAGVATAGDVAFVGVDGAVYALDGSAG